MGKFRRLITGVERQDNSPSTIYAKLEIRRRVLAGVGAERAHVFDGFAGDGTIFAGVWREAASYVGCDEKFFRDDRPCFVCDNRRVLRAIDLRSFTVFDFDAYGSPWDQFYILAARRQLAVGEKVGVALTDGTALKMKMGAVPFGLALLAGVRPTQAGVGLGDMQDRIIWRAVDRVALLMRGTVVKRWQSTGKVGSRMIYLGIVLEGLPT